MKPLIRRRLFSADVFSVLCCVLAAAPAALAQNELIIDDFTTGAYQKLLTTGDDLAPQIGAPDHLVGGVRCTFFGFRGADNPLDQLSILDIRHGHLVVATGVEVVHGLNLLYGYDSKCQVAPLNLDLRSFGRFRLRFRFLDLPTIVVITLNSPSGSSSMFKEIDPGRNFDVDLAFSDFGGTADFGGISQITIVSDSRGDFLSHDYAIDSIKAVL